MGANYRRRRDGGRGAVNYPGLGRLLLDAALRNDIVLLEGGTLVPTFVAVSSQVIGDIGIYFMNPRIRFGDRLL